MIAAETGFVVEDKALVDFVVEGKAFVDLRAVDRAYFDFDAVMDKAFDVVVDKAFVDYDLVEWSLVKVERQLLLNKLHFELLPFFYFSLALY